MRPVSRRCCSASRAARALRAAGLCPDPPGAQAQRRHAAAAVGGIRARRTGERAYRYSQFCVHYHDYRGRLAALDAPGAPRRREAVHRLQRRHRRGDRRRQRARSSPREIFVATLGASKYAYAEATWTQTLPDWIGSTYPDAWSSSGRSRVCWIPDNLKSAIKKACRYEPEATSTYAGLRAPLRRGDFTSPSLSREG